MPAIWLLEFHKVERRLSGKINEGNQTANVILTEALDLPKVNEDTWITLIEQFLMLILIVGRWMLPKGDLTRDQLSQLLLVYIGKGNKNVYAYLEEPDFELYHPSMSLQVQQQIL